jgi:hypothetical protein
MGHAGFLGKWGGEREGKNSGKSFKNPLLPCLCICRGEEAAQCRSKRHRAGFFFFRKGKKIWGDPKMGYDTRRIMKKEEMQEKKKKKKK